MAVSGELETCKERAWQVLRNTVKLILTKGGSGLEILSDLKDPFVIHAIIVDETEDHLSSAYHTWQHMCKSRRELSESDIDAVT